MDNLFDTKGVELPTRPGVPSLAVVTVQGTPGGTPVPVTFGGGGSADVNIAEYGGVATTLGQKAMASSMPVVISSDQSPLNVLVSAGTDRTASGTITAAQNVEINSQASGACGVQLSGIWTGTVVFEATVDGVIWNPVLAVNSVTGSEVTSATANGNWIIACAGFQKVRVRGNVVTSGTATVFLDASTCPQVVTIGGPLPAGSAVIGKTVTRGGSKGTTVEADVTSTPSGADHQLLDVAIYDAAGNQITSFGGGQQYPDGALRGTATGTLAMGDDGTNIQSLCCDPTGKLNLNDISGTISLPTGAATEATLLTLLTQAQLEIELDEKFGDLGQKTMAGSAPVVIASDQSAIPITAAALPLPTGAATAALQTQPGVDIGDVTVNNAAGAAAVNIQDGGNSITVDGTVAVSGSVAVTGPLTDAQLRASAVPISTTQLPAALVGGRLDTNTGAWLGSTAPTVGQKTMAASIPVTLASDQTVIPVSSTPSASTGGTFTQIAGSLVVVTLQALNTARKGLTLYNDGNQAWYVKLGAAASLTSFTVKILRDGYYEVPFGWTGIVTGIQAVSSSSLYVTELT